MAQSNVSVTTVRILDQVYTLRGGEPPEYLERLAEFVDAKMRIISEGSNVVDTQKLAVLAALNIADELHQLRRELEELMQTVEERNLRCREELEQLLSGACVRQQTS